MAFAAREREPQRAPALAVSALLHGALLAAAFLTLNRAPKPLPIPLGEAVPVTAVPTGPAAPAAQAARDVHPAAASEPEPSPTPPAPEPPAPAPEPRPAPPKPAPPLPPEPKPVPPRPAPPKPPPPKPRPPEPKPSPSPPTPAPRPAPPRPSPKPATRARPDLNLDALASSLPAARPHARSESLDLSSVASSVPSRRSASSSSSSLDLSSLASSLPKGSAAARGPDRAETARTARPASGTTTGLSAIEIAQLRAKLNRLWNTDCSLPGADAVVVRVRMRLAPDGSLAGAPSVDGASGAGASPAMVEAATTRALSAVRRGAPYHEISPTHLKTLTQYFDVKFDGKTACG